MKREHGGLLCQQYIYSNISGGYNSIWNRSEKLIFYLKFEMVLSVRKPHELYAILLKIICCHDDFLKVGKDSGIFYWYVWVGKKIAIDLVRSV
jgi:hypothetical protein